MDSAEAPIAPGLEETCGETPAEAAKAMNPAVAKVATTGALESTDFVILYVTIMDTILLLTPKRCNSEHYGVGVGSSTEPKPREKPQCANLESLVDSWCR